MRPEEDYLLVGTVGCDNYVSTFPRREMATMAWMGIRIIVVV